jgi:hypothetical protein
MIDLMDHKNWTIFSNKYKLKTSIMIDHDQSWWIIRIEQFLSTNSNPNDKSWSIMMDQKNGTIFNNKYKFEWLIMIDHDGS